jgi:hypothetical protein
VERERGAENGGRVKRGDHQQESARGRCRDMDSRFSGASSQGVERCESLDVSHTAVGNSFPPHPSIAFLKSGLTDRGPTLLYKV